MASLSNFPALPAGGIQVEGQPVPDHPGDAIAEIVCAFMDERLAFFPGWPHIP